MVRDAIVDIANLTPLYKRVSASVTTLTRPIPDQSLWVVERKGIEVIWRRKTIPCGYIQHETLAIHAEDQLNRIFNKLHPDISTEDVKALFPVYYGSYEKYIQGLEEVLEKLILLEIMRDPRGRK